MKLRLIPVSLACAALVGGLAAPSAQANASAVKQVNQPAATKQGSPGVAPGGRGLNAPSGTAGLAGAITGTLAGAGSWPPGRAGIITAGASRATKVVPTPGSRDSTQLD